MIELIKKIFTNNNSNKIVEESHNNELVDRLSDLVYNEYIDNIASIPENKYCLLNVYISNLYDLRVLINSKNLPSQLAAVSLTKYLLGTDDLKRELSGIMKYLQTSKTPHPIAHHDIVELINTLEYLIKLNQKDRGNGK